MDEISGKAEVGPSHVALAYDR